MVEDVFSRLVALRLLRRLVFVAGLLTGFFLAGLLLASTAEAAPSGGDSSGGGSASGTTSAVIHAVSTKATSSKATSSKATPQKATPEKATPEKATSSKATSGKTTSSKATSSKATSSKATSSKATSSTATSSTATTSAATSVARHEATSSTAAVRTVSPIAWPRTGVVDAVVPRPSAGGSATLGRATSAVASLVPAAEPASVAHRVPKLPIDLTTATTSKLPLDDALAPAAMVTSVVAHAAPAASSLLAPVATVPRTLIQPIGAIGPIDDTLVHTVTGLTQTTTTLTHAVGTLGGLTQTTGVLTSAVGTLGGLTQTATALTSAVGTLGGLPQTTTALTHAVDTLGGLTHTTTALTSAVGTLVGGSIGLSPDAVVGVGALTGIAGAGSPMAPPALAPTPGTGADTLAVITSIPAPAVLLGDAARDPMPADVVPARLTSSGSPSASWLTLDGAAGLVWQGAVPDAPAPGAPVAPTTPAGSTGSSAGSGASVPTGLLTDPPAIPAILTVLVLIACGRRWAWWFPEVAIGPD